MLANRNDVRAVLELTWEQVEKVQKVVAGMDGVEVDNMGMRSTARKVSEKMQDLLDKDQKKRFLEMQGPKIKFTS